MDLQIVVAELLRSVEQMWRRLEELQPDMEERAVEGTEVEEEDVKAVEGIIDRLTVANVGRTARNKLVKRRKRKLRKTMKTDAHTHTCMYIVKRGLEREQERRWRRWIETMPVKTWNG